MGMLMVIFEGGLFLDTGIGIIQKSTKKIGKSYNRRRK